MGEENEIGRLLAPVSDLVWGYDRIAGWLSPALSKRLAKLPADRLATPSPAVAGPALEALRFAAHEPALRDLYANLLATTIDSKTAARAHPAYVEIVKQLAPDEAKLFRIVAERGTEPVVELWADSTRSGGGKLRIRHFNTAVFDAGCEHPERGDLYVDNLVRLGLVSIAAHKSVADEARYRPLEEHEWLKSSRSNIDQAPGLRARIEHALIRLTAVGEQFAEACVLDQERA